MDNGISTAIVAAGPFWANIDLTGGGKSNDSIFYQFYYNTDKKSQPVVQKIQDYIRKHKTQYPTFQSKLALVVTWYQVVPYAKNPSAVLSEVL